MAVYGPDLGMPQTRAMGEGLFELCLNQAAVAVRMAATQSAVARIESVDSGHSPSIATLQRYASALGYKLQVRVVKERDKAARITRRTSVARGLRAYRLYGRIGRPESCQLSTVITGQCDLSRFLNRSLPLPAVPRHIAQSAARARIPRRCKYYNYLFLNNYFCAM
jgi:transcriptional regulator with XRE-family HTH domain